MEALLDVREAGVAFRGIWTFRGWNLTLGRGERLALIGASGCGKTTFLRALTGLVPLSEGAICIQTSRVGYVFQEPRLVPWLDVKGNLRLISGLDPADILGSLHLSGTENLYPHELSGGMRQRLNLARALLTNPELLILDEAFSSLDVALKLRLFEVLNDLWHRRGFSSIAVTHNPRDALLIADRILILGGSPTKVLREIAAPPLKYRSYSSPEIVALESDILSILSSDLE